MQQKLTTTDHRRDSAGLTYIYPVISRRAGGLSIGINLNINNTCNWRCLYCQVPGLKRGSASAVNLALIEQELNSFLRDVIEGDFYDRYQVAAWQRGIRDIAFSGNGEPTSVREFDRVIETVGRTVRTWNPPEKINFVLITNGSLIHQSRVREGIRKLDALGGEVWFKIDSATENGRKRINDAVISQKRVIENLTMASRLCPTWIQTCVFQLDGAPFPEAERSAYLAFLENLLERQVTLRGVLLYGPARPSMQKEAARLAPLSDEWMAAFASDIRQLGIEVKISL